MINQFRLIDIGKGVISGITEANVHSVSPSNTISGGGAALVFSGSGIIISGRTEANYGDVGPNAVDLSYSSGISGTKGATGSNSFASGQNTTASGHYSTASGHYSTASGYYTTASGYNTTASGDYSTALGYFSVASGQTAMAIGGGKAYGQFSFAGGSSTASGQYSFGFGSNTTANSLCEISLGIHPTLFSGNPNLWVGADRVFNIGNGTGTGTRSDALTILKYGDVVAPSLTTAIIATASTKVLITKEYLTGYTSGFITGSTFQQVLDSQSTVIASKTSADGWSNYDLDLTNGSGWYGIWMADTNVSAGSNYIDKDESSITWRGPTSNYQSDIRVKSNGWELLNSLSGNNLTVNHLPPIVDNITISFPAPTATGTTYYIPLTVNGISADSTGNITQVLGGAALQFSPTGQTTGIIKSGRTEANYGDVGLNAVDLSYSDSTSSTKGATGTYSFAVGVNSRASGNNTSIAMGDRAVATGETSIAMGQLSTASGGWSLSFGNGTTASGSYSTASGYYSTASGDNSLALGPFNVASGDASTALGYFNTASSYGETSMGIFTTEYTGGTVDSWVGTDRLFTIGNGTQTSSRSDAFTIYKDGRIEAPSLAISGITGNTQLITKEYADANYSGGTDNAAVIFSPTGNTSAITKSGSTIYYPLGANAVNLGWNNQVEYSGATGDWSFSFGRNPTANGDYSIAGGYVSKGLGTGSVGIGYSANATGPYATALGRSTIASGNTSFAAMYLNKANGDNSLALGQYNTANSFGETVSGVYGTITSGNKTGFNVNDRLFNIGNGTSNASRSDAFTINKDGRIYAPSLTIAEITGNTQLITKEYGDTTYLGGAGAVVFAATGNTTGLVIYNRDEANYGSVGFHAVDLSYSNTPSSTVGATDNYSFATSLNATASGYASIAMGYLTLANNVSSVAIGRGASATGQAAICFGQNTSASGQNSTASGYGSIASGYTSTASGNYTISGNFASTASGYQTTASGYYSFAGGRSTVAESYGEMSIGVWPTLYTGDATAWVGADRIFNVGNGISDGSRSNVLTILKYGDVIAPSLTTAIIASADTKVLITKEYADANYSGGGAYTYSGTSIYPTQAQNYTITSDSNVIAGGQNNTSSGYWSVIGGGDGNIANNVHSTVSAGYQNTASNYYSAIVDGKQNTNSGYYGFIGNGRVNNIEDNYGFIGSGNDNIIIGGGANSGIGSGRFNTISGNTSFSFIAAGENNIAKHNNTFVLGSNITTVSANTTYTENLIVSGTVKTEGYTVAGLPSGVTGTRAYVTDSNVAASGNFGATVAGSGANTVPVFYDGTNWIIA